LESFDVDSLEVAAKR